MELSVVRERAAKAYAETLDAATGTAGRRGGRRPSYVAPGSPSQ
ncbi:MAG: hypothetical protein QOC85_3833 [Streptomyces sp.]|nr:hypothetical protein [Streptomyces sp.]